MYGNSLTPSKVFGLILGLLAGAMLLLWLSFLIAPEEIAFDVVGWIFLGAGLVLLVLAILFIRRVRWVRIVTSILLHLLTLLFVMALTYVLFGGATIGEKIASTAGILFGVGLSFIGILVLHSDAMRRDFTGVSVPQTIRSRKRTVVLAATYCLLVLVALAAWRIVPLLVAKPTITVDYLAQANEIIKPANYDPNLNAAPHYEKLFSQFTPLPEILEHRFKAWPVELILNEYEALKEWAPVNEAVLPALTEAAKRPYWWHELKSDDGSLIGFQRLDHEGIRRCVQGLVLLAKYKASRGDVDGGLQLLTDVHMVGVHQIAGPMLLNELTGAAICRVAHEAMLAILDHCKVEQDTLRRTLDVFASRLPQTHVPRFSQVEHLLRHDHMQRVFTDDGQDNGRLIPGLMYEWKKNRLSLYTHPISFLDAVRICLTQPNREETAQLSDASYAISKGLTQQTPRDLYSQGTSCGEILDKVLSGNYYLHETAASTAGCIEIGWQDRTLAEGTVTVLAILTYNAREGRLPESLDQLVAAGLLPEMPMDPYSNGPLVYRLTDKDFTLYSVSGDFTDSEGVSYGLDDWTIGDYIFWPAQQPVAIEEGEQS